MRISLIGLGYLGAVHAVSMVRLGHEVVGVDVEPARVEALCAGRAPFYEPHLPELLGEAIGSGRATFTTDYAAVAGCAVHFVCVGTPQREVDGAADLSYIDTAFTDLARHLAPGDVVVGKSTVPVGTAERLADQLAVTAPEAGLVWNPEFLREGFAVADTLHPDRLVYGIAADDETSVAVLDEVYATPLAEGIPRLVTDFATAQMVKVAANAFLATKISFINAMAELCEVAGADVTQLADAIGHDARIGRRFLNAGLGFGGGCLPKDIRAFMARADELGAGRALGFLREVDEINLRRRARTVELAIEMCDGSVSGRRIAVLGAAFKPDSDDIRDSPALSVAEQLGERGAHVVVTDPQALPNAIRRYPHLTFADSVEDAAADADLLLLLTEWRQYVALDPKVVAKVVSVPRMLDGRNALDATAWREAGWTYRALGRG